VESVVCYTNVVESGCHPAASFPWYAVRVKPNFEQTTARWLATKGYEQLSPTYRIRRRWSDRVKEVDVPLFPGYIFCRFHPLDRVPIISSPGVISIVSFGKNLAVVDDSEIASLRAVLNSKLGPQPWPFLKTGRKIMIHGGPLTGVEGVMVEVKNHYRLVVSITLLQRSISVEVDREWVRLLN
jgi:transcription antitermination factor NusG